LTDAIVIEIASRGRAARAQYTEAHGRYWGVSQWGPSGGIVDAVWEERERQLRRWGLQERPSGTDANEWAQADIDAHAEYEAALAGGRLTWVHILREEVFEAFAEEDPDKLRAELVQVMAVAASWIQDLDRRGDL
jgi:hypothetical protein